ncbi:MAG: isochorismatase [Longimicrobiales bacterium]
MRLEAYSPRPVGFLGLWEPFDWKIKVYGISAHGERPPRGLVAVARELALRELPRPSVAANRHGVGFLVAHEGSEEEYVQVNWWVHQRMLKSHFFSAPGGSTSPESFRYLTPSGLLGSIWELYVQEFERTAWMHSVLDRDADPDIEEYVLQRFTGEV